MKPNLSFNNKSRIALTSVQKIKSAMDKLLYDYKINKDMLL